MSARDDEDDLQGLENATKTTTTMEEHLALARQVKGCQLPHESEPHRTYIVIVNEDGSLMLHPPGVSISRYNNDGGQTVFPMRVPMSKIKNQENPLVGAIQINANATHFRVRRTRTPSVLYNPTADKVFRHLPDGSEVNMVAGDDSSTEESSSQEEDAAPPPQPSGSRQGQRGQRQPQPQPLPRKQRTTSVTTDGSVNELEQFDPQDLDTMEEVLETAAAREILQNLDLGEREEEVEPESPSDSSDALMDHSYSESGGSGHEISTQGQAQAPQPSGKRITSMSKAAKGQKVNPSAIVPAPAQNVRRRPSATGSAPAAQPKVEPRVPATASAGKEVRKREVSRTPSSSSESCSSANIRRSRRQQDRFERQEAERIMAENQQMLAKEKELMMASSASPAPAANSPVATHALTLEVQTTTHPKLPVAAPTHVPGPAATLTDTSARGPRVTTVSALLKKRLSPTTKTIVAGTARSKSPRAGEMSSNPSRAYPKRENRKIPAHLADPNYVSLDYAVADELKDFEEEDIEAPPEDSWTPAVENEIPAEDEPLKDEPMSGLDVEVDTAGTDSMESDAEFGISEDDPFKLWCICRQPHNNRFMICCDKCEDWFHGKCVGVTKAVGKTIEETKTVWHCPPCKKILRAEAQERKARPPRRVSSDATPGSTQRRPVPLSKRRSSGAPMTMTKEETGIPKLKQTTLPATWNTKAINKGGRRLETVVAMPGGTTSVATPVKEAVPEPAAKPVIVNDCISCKKPAKPDSVYCSNDCVIKHSKRAGRIKPLVSSAIPIDRSIGVAGSGAEVSTVKGSPSVVGSGAEVSTVKGSPSVAGSGAEVSTVKGSPSVAGSGAGVSTVKGSLPVAVTANVTAKPVTTPTTPTPIPASTPSTSKDSSKLKRTNSTVGNVENFLTFHVLTPGSSKSTEVVPAKQKDGAVPKQISSAAAAITPSSSTPTPTAPPQQPSGTVAQPKILVKKLSAQTQPKSTEVKEKERDGARSSNQVKSSLSKSGHVSSSKVTTSKLERKGSTISLTESSGLGERERSARQRERNLSTSTSSKPQEREKRRHREKEIEKLEKPDPVTSEAEQRKIMRKTLVVILTSRVDTTQGGLSPNHKELAAIAAEIEEELVQCFTGWSNPKCKNKYRSIIFNLKDPKNALYLDLLNGTLLAKDLVRMEAHQMASAELTEWRLRQNEKELESIKRSELEKLAEAKKQELIDAGTEFDKVATAEAEERSKTITDVILSSEETTTPAVTKEASPPPVEKKLESSKSKSSRSYGSSSSSSHKSRSKKKSKDRHRDKERDRRHSDKERREEKPKELKAKTQESKDKETESSGTIKGDKEKLDKESKDEERKELPTPRSEPSSVDETSMTSTPFASEDSSSQSQLLTSASSQETNTPITPIDTTEQPELPSSTIKTPDFTDDSIGGKTIGTWPAGAVANPGILTTKLVMPELGQFNARLFHVSHSQVDGLFFPETPVPIVGRISPSTVWDYISKMKKNKELIVFRLAPAHPSDTEGYMSFFTYLSARSRFGVLGGITAPLKDVYLIPQERHLPINRTLLPYKGGPGLPTDRVHCLLAVVVRNELSPAYPSVALSKRLISSNSLASPETSVPKKPKLTPGVEIKAGLISSLHLAKGKSTTVKGVTDSSDDSLEGREALVKSPDSDDDTPYAPWEEDDEGSEELGARLAIPKAMSLPIPTSPPPEKTQAQLLLEELNARIEKEKQEIESISVAISRNEVATGIPGLDGEFVGSSTDDKVTSTANDLQFLMRLPSLQEKPTPKISAPILTSLGKPKLTPAPTPEKTSVAEVIHLDDELPSKARRRMSYSSDDDEPMLLPTAKLEKIPGIGDIDERVISSTPARSPAPSRPSPRVMDLDDRVRDLDERIFDLEPPPLTPAERPIQPMSINIRGSSMSSLFSSPPPKLQAQGRAQVTPASSSSTSTYESARSSLSLSPPTPSPARGKISINLSTKSLPVLEPSPPPPVPAFQGLGQGIVDIVNTKPPTLERMPLPPLPPDVNLSIPPPSFFPNVPPPPIVPSALVHVQPPPPLPMPMSMTTPPPRMTPMPSLRFLGPPPQPPTMTMTPPTGNPDMGMPQLLRPEERGMGYKSPPRADPKERERDRDRDREGTAPMGKERDRWQSGSNSKFDGERDRNRNRSGGGFSGQRSKGHGSDEWGDRDRRDRSHRQREKRSRSRSRERERPQVDRRWRPSDGDQIERVCRNLSPTMALGGVPPWKRFGRGGRGGPLGLRRRRSRSPPVPRNPRHRRSRSRSRSRSRDRNHSRRNRRSKSRDNSDSRSRDRSDRPRRTRRSKSRSRSRSTSRPRGRNRSPPRSKGKSISATRSKSRSRSKEKEIKVKSLDKDTVDSNEKVNLSTERSEVTEKSLEEVKMPKLSAAVETQELSPWESEPEPGRDSD